MMMMMMMVMKKKWLATLVFACWAFSARIAAADQFDARFRLSNASNIDSGFSSPKDFLSGDESGKMKTMEEMESSRESIENVFRSNLDLFNLEKVNLFLREKGHNVSRVCSQNLMEYLTGVRRNQSWAIKILDATGSYSSTFLFGNDFWLGSQTECLDLRYSSTGNDSPPFPVAYFAAKYLATLNVSSTMQNRPIRLGICLPAECGENDLRPMLKNFASSSAVLKALRKVPNPNYNFYLEPIGIALLALTIIGMALVLLGTWKDISMEKEQIEAFAQVQRNKQIAENKTSLKISTIEKLRFYVNHHVEGNHHHKGSELGLTESINSINSSTSSPSVSSFDPTEKKIGVGTQILLCFSFKRNFLKICNTKTTDSLACVHGLRVFSLLWVIAGHTCMITMPFVDNRSFREIVERDFLFQSISNGAFSVDTFFFISGLLISYVFYKAEIEKNSGKDETGKTFARNSFLKFVGGVTYRFIRLTPPYGVVLVLTHLTGRWFYFNSVFDPPTGDHFTCQKFWWRNLLYINTLFPVEQMCMIWSWYLADDTQFYFLGLIILLISSRYAKGATFFTAIFLVCSWITTLVITLQTQHKPSIEEPLGLFDQLYDKPWTRLAPYIVGMAVGIYLAKINCKATYHKGLVAFFWIISMLTTFILVHGLYGELGQIESAAYVAFSHTAWALAISWVIVACVTGYGGPVNAILSSKMFAPLSRLTYCAYLVHPLIMLSAMAHMDGAIHLQRDTMIISIFGYFFASYLASIVLTIIFEAPAVALLNRFHPLKKKAK